MRKTLAGIVVIGLYALAVWWTHVPVRPLYDGILPAQPYNWVKPPLGTKNKKTPKPFAQNVEIGPKGNVGANLATPDGQAVVIAPEGSFAKHAADTRIRVRFVPLDPGKVQPKVKGPAAQGNAYKITAVYEPSGAVAQPAAPVTVLLRYPAHAATILRLADGKWSPLKAQNLATSLQIYGNTNKLGTFVAAGGRSNTYTLWLITAGICVIAAILGLLLGLRERRAGSGTRRN